MTLMRPRKYVLDVTGEPLPCDDLFPWASWLESSIDERQVALSVPVPGVTVSTIFIGIDTRYFGDGPPILWETMVFGGPLDREIERYSSKEEALMGHAELVVRVREAAILEELEP